MNIIDLSTKRSRKGYALSNLMLDHAPPMSMPPVGRIWLLLGEVEGERLMIFEPSLVDLANLPGSQLIESALVRSCDAQARTQGQVPCLVVCWLGEGEGTAGVVGLEAP